MPSQVKAATEELASVLKTIDNVVTKRANAGYLDAGNGKAGANAKRIKTMMDGVSESLSTKVKKVVKVVERQSSGAVVDTVDEEAVARVEACKKEMAEVSGRVESLRKIVMEKAAAVETKELSVRGEVEFKNGEEATEDNDGDDEQAQIDAMKGSMTKLGNHLVNLAQTMPDKMEGLSKTIEAVTDGHKKDDDDVNEAIAKGSKAGDFDGDRSLLNDSAMTEGTEGTEGGEEESEEEDNAEDMFASMVGR